MSKTVNVHSCEGQITTMNLVHPIEESYKESGNLKESHRIRAESGGIVRNQGESGGIRRNREESGGIGRESGGIMGNQEESWGIRKKR